MKQKPNLWREHAFFSGCNSSSMAAKVMQWYGRWWWWWWHYKITTWKKNYTPTGIVERKTAWKTRSLVFRHRKIADHILCSIYLPHTCRHTWAIFVPWFPTDYHHYSNNYYCHYYFPQHTTVFPRILLMSLLHTHTHMHEAHRRTFKVSLLNAKWTTPTLCLRTKY